MMDSCVEVYRLARWRAIDERRIEWTEDTARIEADIAEITAERMQLRLKLTDGIKEENYRLAQVPFVCRDSHGDKRTSITQLRIPITQFPDSHYPRPMSTTVGFIGLGVMGRPMAKHVMAKGHRLIVHSRSPQPVEELVAAGATAATSPADVARQSGVVITMLPDTPDVELVIGGPNGVADGVKPGAVVIDMSSISPVVARRLAALVATRGATMLDAPVSGGEIGAVNATLSIMVGGDPDAFARGTAGARLHGSRRSHRAHRRRAGIGPDLQGLQPDRDRRRAGGRERGFRGCPKGRCRRRAGPLRRSWKDSRPAASGKSTASACSPTTTHPASARSSIRKTCASPTKPRPRHAVADSRDGARRATGERAGGVRWRRSGLLGDRDGHLRHGRECQAGNESPALQPVSSSVFRFPDRRSVIPRALPGSPLAAQGSLDLPPSLKLDRRSRSGLPSRALATASERREARLLSDPDAKPLSDAERLLAAARTSADIHPDPAAQIPSCRRTDPSEPTTIFAWLLISACSASTSFTMTNSVDVWPARSVVS